ncbi:MAG TPA: CHAT domain-containing tetratricopeptide repeat protein [Chryseolinea sp.]
MKEIRLGSAFFLTTVLAAAATVATAQCLQSPQAWLDKVRSIETSESISSEKISALLSLESLYEKCVDQRDSVYAVLIHRLGNIYMWQDNYELAVRYTKGAVKINNSPTKLAQRSFLAHSYFNLALIYDRINLQADSRKYFDSCIAVASRYPEKMFIALLAYEKQAFSFFQSGDYQKSIDMADKGILLAARDNDVLSEGLLMQKAQAQLELNEIGSAEQIIQRMIRVLEGGKGDAEYLASAYSVYGKLLVRKEKPAEGALYYRKAADDNRKNKLWEQCSRDLQDLGLVYDEYLHDPVKATDCYREAMELSQQLNDVSQLAALYNNMGMLHWRQKEFRAALKYYQQGLATMTGLSIDTSFTALIPLAALRETANDNFVSTLLANKGESLLALYMEERDHSLLKLALETFKLTDKMVDQLRWKQAGERSKLYWRNFTRNWYEHAIEICYQLNDVKNGFFFLEKSRSVLLNDKLNELGAQSNLAAADVEQDQQLRARKFSFERQLMSLEEHDPTYLEVQQEYFASQENMERFILGLEEKYPSYYRYKYDTAAPSLDALRREVLHDDISLITYFTTPSLVYTLVIKPDGAEFKKIEYTDYHKDAVQLISICADKEAINADHGSYAKLANRMFTKLIEPLTITTTRLIVSQDDYFIPFEALIRDPDVPGDYLLKYYAITYAYSVGYLMQNKNKVSEADSWLGVTPLKFSSSLNVPSLLGADESLKNIGAGFSSPHFLMDEEATKGKFLREFPSYTIVHLYSHAKADSTGTEPALYFYDSLLTLSELQTLDKPHARLIVLTACETGAGKQMQGEGVFSLARGFAAAGIPSTVTTLWQIDEKATYQLTELFYKYLRDGNPGDVAIQKAKLEFIATNDVEYSLPYYWAPTILIGQTGAIQESKKVAMVAYALAGILFVVGIYVVIRKRYSRGSA